jgi:hypothetical protein
MMRLRNCSACHRPVKWALTVNSKYLPLDPDPDPAGNQAVHYDHTSTLRTRQLGKDQQPYAYERLYMPHVATCTGPKPPGPPRPLAPVPVPSNVTPITSAPSLRRGIPPRRTPAGRRGNR